MACVILVKNKNFLKSSSSKDDPDDGSFCCEPEGVDLIGRLGVGGFMIIEGLLVEDFFSSESSLFDFPLSVSTRSNSASTSG